MEFLMLMKYDIVWLNMIPQLGKEEGPHSKKRPYRPVIICSNHFYNQMGLIIGMPITSHKSGVGPFNNALIPVITTQHKIKGYAIPFRIGGYDYKARHAEKIDSLSSISQQQINQVLKDSIADDN